MTEETPKHPGGRPTKDTPELREEAEWYLENYQDELEQPFPSIAGLALHLDIRKETCIDWNNKHEEHPEFSNLYEKVMKKQELYLTINGLNGETAPAITKLMLTKHGYSDKIESDNTNNNNLKVSGSFKVTLIKPDA